MGIAKSSNLFFLMFLSFIKPLYILPVNRIIYHVKHNNKGGYRISERGCDLGKLLTVKY